MMMNHLKDGLSANEAKISALVISMIITLGFGLYRVVVDGDLGDNILTLLGYQIMAVTGINVADSVASKSKKNYSDVGE